MPSAPKPAHERTEPPKAEVEAVYGRRFALKNFTGVIEEVDRGWLRRLQSIFSPQEPLLVFKKYAGEVERKG